MIFATLIGSDEKAGSFATRLWLYLVENPDAGGHHHRFLSRSSGLWCWSSGKPGEPLVTTLDQGAHVNQASNQPGLNAPRLASQRHSSPLPFLLSPSTVILLKSRLFQAASLSGCSGEGEYRIFGKVTT